ncbi:hypothetical protein KKH27_03410, partial [bacterium]|nr:hypothetical protein [bacterium]
CSCLISPSLNPRDFAAEGAAKVDGGFIDGELVDRCPGSTRGLEAELVQYLFHRDLGTQHVKVNPRHNPFHLSQ